MSSNVVLALLVGLVAGLAGGVVGHLAFDDTGGGGTSADVTVANPELEARLDRIESMLADLRPAKTLSGRPAPAAGSDAAPVVKLDLDDAVLAALEARLAETVKSSVRESVEEQLGGDNVIEFQPEPPKKKMTLAEAAAELELSPDEEAAVRRIHDETMEKMLSLAATEDETVEDIRRALEDAKGDPAKQAALGGRLMGRVMGNLGGFIGAAMEHQTKMVQAIGSEKADRLDNEYELTDMDPYGIESMFEGFGG